MPIPGKKIYLSKVLRLDQKEHEDGLLVKHIEIVMWSNQTGMDLEQENIIISAECGSKKLEFNLLKPCKDYQFMFKEVYSMAYFHIWETGLSRGSLRLQMINCHSRTKNF